MDRNFNYNDMAEVFYKTIFEATRHSAYPILDWGFVEERLVLTEEDFVAAAQDSIFYADEWELTYDVADWIVDELNEYYDLTVEDWNCTDPCETTDWNFQLQGYYNVFIEALEAAYSVK